MLRTLFFTLLCACTLQAQQISAENVVPNRSEPGVCWWACADMVGREKQIKPLIGLTEKVIETGIGHKTGARPQDIAYWMKELGVTITEINKKDTSWIREQLAVGNPVLVNMARWMGTPMLHTIIVTDISKDKQRWELGGVVYFDYIVTWTDSNKVTSNFAQTLTWFEKSWTGEAYVFDPKKQEAKKDVTTDKPKGTVVIPLIKVDPAVDSNKSVADIKDGVNRPDDLFRVPGVVPNTIDYYRDFREKLQKEKP